MTRTIRFGLLALAAASGFLAASLLPTTTNTAQAQYLRRGGNVYYTRDYGSPYGGYNGFGWGPYGYGQYEYIPYENNVNPYPYARRTYYGGLFPGRNSRFRYEQSYPHYFEDGSTYFYGN